MDLAWMDPRTAKTLLVMSERAQACTPSSLYGALVC